jgi:uncharacterized protein (TIGR03437 family)
LALVRRSGGRLFPQPSEIFKKARIKIEDAIHPSTQNLPAVWERTDEWYDFRFNPRGRVRVLASLDESSYQGGAMGADHPIAWCQLYDGGRAWYTAGGHTNESYGEPLFLQHLLGGIQFAAGLKEADASALSGVSAASFRRGAVARESIAAVFGVDLANEQESATSLPLPTMLAGTSLRVKDRLGVERLAPLFFVSPNQINFLVPPGSASGTASLTVLKTDGTRPSTILQLSLLAPGLFAANANGQGVAAGVALRVRQNIRSFVPLARYDAGLGRFVAVPLEFLAPDEELFLVLFGTGVRGRSENETVSLKLGGEPVPVLFAGRARRVGWRRPDQCAVAAQLDWARRSEYRIASRRANGECGDDSGAVTWVRTLPACRAWRRTECERKNR